VIGDGGEPTPSIGTNGPVTASIAVKDYGALAFVLDEVFHLHGCISLLKAYSVGFAANVLSSVLRGAPSRRSD
jgi:hypothetical protein